MRIDCGYQSTVTDNKINKRKEKNHVSLHNDPDRQNNKKNQKDCKSLSS